MKWIKISDALPKVNKPLVIACGKEIGTSLHIYTKMGEWRGYNVMLPTQGVTHWMYIERPKTNRTLRK